MAKKAQQNMVKSNDGVSFEQNTIYDDNLLPPAEELAKINEVSPEIIPWIMARTEKEQDARISFNKRRIHLAETDIKRTHFYSKE